jgi:Bax protein
MPQSIVSAILLTIVLATTLVGLADISPEGHAPITTFSGDGNLPDFRDIPTAAQRKTRFFEYLRPIVQSENRGISRERQRLEALVDKLRQGRKLSRTGWRWMHNLADSYQVESANRRRLAIAEDLLRKVDVVPVSLVLVQAAKESAWGLSRFARNGNNLFGEHCFESDCGIVPKRRDPGKRHEVETFPTVRDSVRSYLHNLNSHPKYVELRAIRAQLRTAGKPVTGLALAKGLWFYSERRQQYIAEVRNMIRNNGLAEFDQED